MNPSFSIIIPTFNRAYCLWKSIQSVIAQTYPYFEIIVIDDASVDDTIKLIKEFSDPRIKLIQHKVNKGPSAARNSGLQIANGKYIAYLDSDNIWYSDFLEVMHKSFRNNPDKSLIYCKKNYRLNIIDENGKEEVIRDETTNHRNYFDLKRLWHRKIIIDTNCLVHKKEVYNNIGGWDENLNFWEDYEYTLRIAQKYPKGIMALNRVMLDYEQVLSLEDKAENQQKWSEAEKYIFEKYHDEPLLQGQSWYPAEEGYKSTFNVLERLNSKKCNSKN